MKFPSRLVFFLIIGFVIVIVILGSLGSIYQLLTKPKYSNYLVSKRVYSFEDKNINFNKTEVDANINYNFTLN